MVADHRSQLLCCPTELAIHNLRREGLEQRAVLTGDVMYDAALTYRQLADNRVWPSALIQRDPGFALATAHRAENTDDLTRLRGIISALERIAAGLCPVLWPVDPRIRKRIEETGLRTSLITIIEPVSDLDTLLLEGRARFILTDSGGLQKEAYFFKVPCITLRDKTEWIETFENRCNVVTGCSEERILEAASTAEKCGPWKSSYGDGDAGNSILEALRRPTPAPVLSSTPVRPRTVRRFRMGPSLPFRLPPLDPVHGLRCQPVKRLHCHFQVLFFSILKLGVTETPEGLHEHHYRRDPRPGHLGSIVQRSGRKAMRRTGHLAHGFVAQLQ